MTKKEFYFLSADKKTNIHAVEWIPDEEPRAILQISHGVTEHILCYEEFAEYFTERGFVVAGNDHIGHGTSITKGATPMYFGPDGSWFWAAEDLYTCREHLKKRHGELPCIIMGLSLGSFLARSCAIHHPGMADGLVLAGTGQSAAWQLSMIRWIVKIIAKKSGDDSTTPLIQNLSFGTYNKQFAPNETDFDWLCASREGLRNYIDDPLRGEKMSAGLFREMLNGMIFTGDLENQKKMDKSNPILLISGEDDPVGERGKGVYRTLQSLSKAGVKDVTIKIYPDMRHDIFLETKRYDIFHYIHLWIEAHCIGGLGVQL